MQQIYCDACGKQIKNASRGINYVTVTTKEMCLPCNAKFEEKVSTSMMSKKRYIFLDGKKILLDTLNRMCR
ncbi:MAG: hypothetical protein JXD23_00720 [Spirochaetales bacterium]|nr:hypothetical protein [Spirochaetales bacterium]